MRRDAWPPHQARGMPTFDYIDCMAFSMLDPRATGPASGPLVVPPPMGFAARLPRPDGRRLLHDLGVFVFVLVRVFVRVFVLVFVFVFVCRARASAITDTRCGA